MKRLILILLLFTTSALADDMQIARTNPYIAGGNYSAAATCTELTLGWTPGAYSTDQIIANASGNEYGAAEFTAGDWGTISKIQLYIHKGSGSSDLTGQSWVIQLYTSTNPAGAGADPSTKVTNGNCTIATPNTTIPANASPGWVGCVLSTPVQLTNGTYYHIGLNNSGVNDATDYVRWRYDATGGSGFHQNKKDADEPGTWTANDANAYNSMKFFTGAGCTAP